VKEALIYIKEVSPFGAGKGAWRRFGPDNANANCQLHQACMPQQSTDKYDFLPK